MSSSLFCITFFYKSGFTPTDSLDPAMSTIAGGEWLRINTNTYFAWTNLTAEQAYNALKHLASQEDSIVIVAIDPTKRFGWAPQWVWNWIDRVAQVQTLQQQTNPTRNPPTGPLQSNPLQGLLSGKNN